MLCGLFSDRLGEDGVLRVKENGSGGGLVLQ